MKWMVGEQEAGTRLDKFLAAPDRLGSRGRAADALARRKVLVNDEDATLEAGSRRLAGGDVVRLWMDRPGSAHRPLRRIDGGLPIVYEDASLLVLNKPAGLLAVPLDRRSDAVSAYGLIQNRLRSHAARRPFVVHRIDRDTSGLVVFARTPEAQAALKDQFRRREPERVYQAIVYGHPTPVRGRWRDYLAWDEGASLQKPSHARDKRAKEAISRYRVMEQFDEASLVEVRLETGKQNQIRVQALIAGHPLVGERRYVAGRDSLRPIAFGRQALHAFRLAFLHPDDGRPVAFEAPLPDDMRELLLTLRERS